MSRIVLLSTGAMTRDPVQTDHGEIVRHGPGLGVPGFELGIYSAWYGFEPRNYLNGACRSRKTCSNTLRHRDHLHIGLTKAGAAKKTSFWTR